MTQKDEKIREENSAVDKKGWKKHPKYWNLKDWSYIIGMVLFGGTATQSGSIAEGFNGLFSPISREEFSELQKTLTEIKNKLSPMVSDYQKMIESGISLTSIGKHLENKEKHEDDANRTRRIVSEFNLRIAPFITAITAIQESQTISEQRLYDIAKYLPLPSMIK